MTLTAGFLAKNRQISAKSRWVNEIERVLSTVIFEVASLEKVEFSAELIHKTRV